MIAPMDKEDYEYKSIKQLVIERQKLIKEIIKYEDEYILEKTISKPNDVIMEPSPEVFWIVNNSNLIMLTELIEEKRKKDEFLM